MEKNKEYVGMVTGVLIGILISIVLSVVGPIISGHPSVPSVLVSLLCSSIMSILIGLFVPIKKITDGACSRMKMSPDGLLGRIVFALLSDLFFTPIISFLMVFMNYKRARMHDSNVALGRMYFGNLIVSYSVAFFLILIFTPLLVKLAIKLVSNVANAENPGVSELDESITKRNEDE